MMIENILVIIGVILILSYLGFWLYRKSFKKIDQVIRPQADFKKEFLRTWGVKDAGFNAANPESLRQCLSAVYADYRQDIKSRAHEYQEKINVLREQNKNCQAEIGKIDEEIALKEDEIKKLNEELREIEVNPKKFEIESEFSPLGFSVGTALLVFLTLYLLLFYTSAIYSAFFKNLGESLMQSTGGDIDIKVLFNSIFDPRALQEASSAGSYALVFTLLAPFLFLGTGFVLYAVSQKEQDAAYKKYLRIVSIILFVFLADVAIAYKITQEIYEAKLLTGVVTEEWQPSMIFHDVNFYLVLVGGFAAYIIWSTLLDYVVEEFNNSRPIFNAKRKRTKQIKEIKNEIKKNKENARNLRNQISSNENEIKKLEDLRDTRIISWEDLSSNLDTYFTGWQSYINTLYGGEAKRPERDQIMKEAQEKLERFKNNIGRRYNDIDSVDIKFE